MKLGLVVPHIKMQYQMQSCNLDSKFKVTATYVIKIPTSRNFVVYSQIWMKHGMVVPHIKTMCRVWKFITLGQRSRSQQTFFLEGWRGCANGDINVLQISLVSLNFDIFIYIYIVKPQSWQRTVCCYCCCCCSSTALPGRTGPPTFGFKGVTIQLFSYWQIHSNTQPVHPCVYIFKWSHFGPFKVVTSTCTSQNICVMMPQN